MKPAFSRSRRAVYRPSLAQDTPKKINSEYFAQFVHYCVVALWHTWNIYVCYRGSTGVSHTSTIVDRLGFREGARVLLRLAPKPCGAPCGISFFIHKLQVHLRLSQKSLCTKLLASPKLWCLQSPLRVLFIVIFRKQLKKVLFFYEHACFSGGRPWERVEREIACLAACHVISDTAMLPRAVQLVWAEKAAVRMCSLPYSLYGCMNRTTVP